jgi:hypothetical protein
VEEELKSADCPAKVSVTLGAPSVATDAKMKASWAADMASYEDDPAKAAEAQLTELSSHVAKARAEKAVTLTGTLGRACFYTTVDAATGHPNGYSVWFAKTSGPRGGLQLRITRQLDNAADTLFFKAPVKTLTPSSVVMDTSKNATVYAQHLVPEYHGEPGGPNAWIGSANVSAKIAR